MTVLLESLLCLESYHVHLDASGAGTAKNCVPGHAL